VIIDSLMTLGASRFGTELSEEAALEQCDREGINVVVATIAHPTDHDFMRANGELTACVERSAGRLVGVCRVDPWDGESGLALLERSVRSGNHRGLVLHPAEEHFRINDRRLVPFAHLAAELDIPVIIASGYPWLSEPTQVAEFARWCPSVPIIMTNGGQYNISGLSQTDAESALGLSNIHLHTSGVYREDFLQKVVASFGFERLLFASSAPVFNLVYEKLRVEYLHVGQHEREAILGGNAQRIFSIEDRAGA